MAYLLKKIPSIYVKPIVIIFIIFITVDCIISGYAIDLFTIRMIAQNDLNVANKQIIIETYQELEQRTWLKNITNTFFNNEKIIKTYPNLKVELLDGNMVYFKDLLPDIEPYFFKFSEQDFYK